MTGDRPRFVADEMLGKLAKELRALGYDTLYLKHVDDDEVLDRALAEDRLLLTRDQELADRADDTGVLIRSREPAEQLARVLDALGLDPEAEAFLSRCLECNGLLEEDPDAADLPDGVEDQTTWRCPGCQKVYWWGTHAEDMYERLGGLLVDEPPARPDAERNR